MRPQRTVARMNSVFMLVGALVCAHPKRMFGSDVQACSDIEKVDFKNHVVVAKVRDTTITGDDASAITFRFRKGIFDEGDVVDGKFILDFRSTIESDIVLHPAPQIAIRFLEIFQNHIGGSGSLNYLLGFRCLNGRIRQVFQQSGNGMQVLHLSPTDIRLRFGVWKDDPQCCPSLEKESRFAWDGATGIFVLKEEDWKNLR